MYERGRASPSIDVALKLGDVTQPNLPCPRCRTSATLNPELLGSSPDHPSNELVYEKLPLDICDRYVMLMDPILGTGNTAKRAIQVLLSKGVEEKKIFFLTLIAAPEGIHHVCGTFPRVTVITSEIDSGINENFQVVPGIGEFGDRYFCD